MIIFSHQPFRFTHLRHSMLTAQKMASMHMIRRCQAIPKEIREQLVSLKQAAKSSDGGGKKYWSDTLKRMGVEETKTEGLILQAKIKG